MQHYKYTLTDLNSMIPWERSVYISLLAEHVRAENDRLKEEMKRR